MPKNNSPINLPAPPAGSALAGFFPFGSNEEQLTALSKITGGIPDFAKEALVKAGGFDPSMVDRADKEGRK